MAALERILVALDLSPVSDILVDYAGRLAQRYKTELVLFHAIDSSLFEHAAAGFDPNTIIAKLEDEARERLNKYKEELESRGISVFVHPEIPVTDPPAGIVAAAAKEGASEILVASKGSGFRKMIAIGSTAKAVAKLSKTPVIVVRVLRGEKPEIRAPAEVADKPVLAVDENVTEDMAAYAADLAKKGDADHLVVLHVIEGAGEEEARRLLERVAKIVESRGVKAMKVILEGKPARVIARFATPPAATTIVMGRTLHKSLGELVFGSTLDRVLVEAEVAVIVYPLQAPES